MGIQAVIVTKSSWEKWNSSDGLKAVGYLHEAGFGELATAKGREPGACGWLLGPLWVCWLTSVGTLTFLHLGSHQLGPRALARLSSSRSEQRTVQHEGQVLFKQRTQEVCFPNLGSTCFPCFCSMLLDLRRDLASLNGAFWEWLLQL